jgi:hypothetical protein
MKEVAALCLPKEIKVSVNGNGNPALIDTGRERRKVTRVQNTWRIDEEWWREEISRCYWRLEFSDGSVDTVFQDLISGKWYQQRY